jgi:hypothetical protein
MYRLQDKTSKEEPKNGTRKRFRGGEELSASQIGSSEIPPVEPLPTVVDQSIAAPTDVPPVDVAPVDVPPVDVAPVDVAPVDALPTEVAPVDVPPAEVAPVDAPPSEVAPVDAPPVDALPVNEFEAPPTNEFEAPPVNEFEAPPSDDQSIQAETEVFGEQPGVTGEGESAEIEAFRNMMGTPEAQQVYLYMNTNISTEENRDKSYKREGVLHFTDSVSVGANQNTVMSLGSVIGNRGIETTTYDKLRNIALQKVGIILGETRRCYNTKIGFERNGETILVHIYGTVYTKKSEQPTI